MAVEAAEGGRATAWFLWGSAAYFLIQALQRILLGGTLEVDEAEMVLLADGWHWGYGPQLPLYNWAQVLTFAVLGKTVAGLALLKGLVLWLAGTGMWFAMRAAFGGGQAAAAAALSLAFLPNVLWEFQRASSHSIALLAAVTWTLWAWFRLMSHQRAADWLMLGLIVGLSGLSKANFWAVPAGLILASIGYWPRRVGWRGPVMAVAVAALIVAVPYGWAAMNPDQSLASVHKFYQPDMGRWPWLVGLGLLAGSVVAALVLPALIGGAIWALGARGRMVGWSDAARLLLRASVLPLGVAVLLVIAFDVTKIQARWLVPVYIFLTAAVFARLGASLSPRAFRSIPVLAVVCAAVTVIGMTQIRLEGGRTATLDLAPLSLLADRLAPDRIEGDYFLAGNLEILEPIRDTAVLGTLARSGADGLRVLNLGPMSVLPAGVQVLDAGTLDLGYEGAPDKRYHVEWQLIGLPGD
jgi:Dolichyl-phosphate-mannose-protein mannosyltransferase